MLGRFISVLWPHSQLYSIYIYMCGTTAVAQLLSGGTAVSADSSLSRHHLFTLQATQSRHGHVCVM